MEELILYSNNCPRCKILEKELNENGIKYVKNENVEEMVKLGIEMVPVLCVSGELMNFTEATKWIVSNGR